MQKLQVDKLKLGCFAYRILKRLRLEDHVFKTARILCLKEDSRTSAFSYC
ncbi:unnamed protein product [Coffea canephora]|uniref:DH200=94 genomic scaffold, scaffold_977 n=1 Tax=Coffea canephora TaxID=49390 RepID=A0A068VKL8_COFCA|nr:unnamed protein product [Coffea canephora]